MKAARASLLAAGLGLAALPPVQADPAPGRQAAAPSRQQLREAVQAHRASERAQIQRDEAIAGRRLTPAERAELRQQLRDEWAQRPADVPASQAHRVGWSWRSLLPWSRSAP